jgi:hypothetical protein
LVVREHFVFDLEIIVDLHLRVYDFEQIGLVCR